MQCAFNRHMDSFTIDSGSLYLNTAYEFRAGFNLYYDKFDGSPDSTGVSEVLSFVILDGAVRLATGFALAVALMV